METKTNVVVLGASHKPDRYSHKAVKLLRQNGYNPIPVHPRGNPVDGIPTRETLEEVHEDVHTITLYVNAGVSTELTDSIIGVNPERVIFNPGAENKSLEEKCGEQGIRTVTGCTLVLLTTGQF